VVAEQPNIWLVLVSGRYRNPNIDQGRGLPDYQFHIIVIYISLCSCSLFAAMYCILFELFDFDLVEIGWASNRHSPVVMQCKSHHLGMNYVGK
jgi:hypothetical protein